MPVLFEVSWEVCNKVGGIYTVVSSKAEEIMKRYDEYFLVGPYFADHARGVFEEEPAPEQCKGCVDKLSQMGIKVHVGRWLIKGSPNVLLIDYSEMRGRANEIKGHLWEKYGLDSLGTMFYDFDEPLVWAWAAGMVVEEWSLALKQEVIVQAHEWLSGGALLYVKEYLKGAGTVFTTHATMLGRTLASHGKDLYGSLDSIDAPAVAQGFGPAVWAKFQCEKILAHEADVFTTVSEITALEAEKLLGKRPEVILPNGLDTEQFPTLEETSVKRKVLRQKLETFLMYYFFPYYHFDLDSTMIMFTGGRYEFRAKGLDVFVDALAELNRKLIEEKCERTIVVFFWVPAGARGIKPEVIGNRALFFDVKDTIEDSAGHAKNRMIELLLSSKPLSSEVLFSEDVLTDLKIKSRRFKQGGTPPLVTHDLHDEEFDPILRRLRERGLDNSEGQPVKVVFYPIYLTGADGLLDLTYYEATSGADVGVFASYYEPWGYTPLESAAHAVSAITTDLAGFGAHVSAHNREGQSPGVIVLARRGVSDAQVVGALADQLYEFVHGSKAALVRQRVRAKEVANDTNWNNFVGFYTQAHELALKRARERL